MSEYRGKRHEPLASEEFIGCCALCGADLGHWWHESVEIEGEAAVCPRHGALGEFDFDPMQPCEDYPSCNRGRPNQ